MCKRLLAIASAVAVLGSTLLALPGRAQDAPAPPIPSAPNITDVAGDSNGHSFATGTAGGAYIGAADYLAAWFTHDPQNLYVHIHTSSQSFSAGSIWYSVWVDPGVGADCMEFRGLTQHQAVTASGRLILTGDCGELTETVEFVTQEGPEIEGSVSGIHTITVPRSLTEHLADGKTLAIPNALSRYYAGTDNTGGGGLGTLDNTEEGTPYVITTGSSSEGSAGEEPPGKGDPPGKGKKKGCPKGKGQKKGACPGKKKPKPPVASCAPYTPGEEGAEAETSVITEAATEEKPVVVEYEAEMGGPSSPLVDAFDFRSFVFHNVQVDSANPDIGLYVKTEFTEFHDYDLALFHSDGSEAASSGESQPVAGAGGGSPDGAWEGGSNYEFLKGIRTADCGGYTARVAGYLTSGGPVTISMWLGPVVGDPAPPEGDGATAADMFFDLLGARNPLG